MKKTFTESEELELKEIITDDIKKEAIAFANTRGGKILVGITDSGEVIGLSDTNEATQQAANMLRDAVRPDITMFINYATRSAAGKKYLEITVQQGTNRPYYLARKGLRPEGVFVRQGTSSAPATATAIRQMIKETDGDSFEERRSLLQELTFSAAEKEFSDHHLQFSQSQKQTLKLLTPAGMYTNLALLLSDECPHTSKVAVFDAEEQSHFRDRREFSGSIFTQLNNVYTFIDRYNALQSEFSGLRRTDRRDYPETALREALLNAFIHRDYAYRSSIFISIYSDRIEITSLGGLLPGLETDDIMIGVSVCRNPLLANIFYRLQLIEAYGTGIKKIMQSYNNSAEKPQITVTSNAFKITLPNLNRQKQSPMPCPVPNDNIKKLMQVINKTGSITRREAENILGLSPASTGRIIKKLLSAGLLQQEGKGKNTHYLLRRN